MSFTNCMKRGKFDCCVTFLLHGRGEHVVRLEPDLELHAVGDRHGLGEVQIELPQRGQPQAIIPERGGSGGSGRGRAGLATLP